MKRSPALHPQRLLPLHGGGARAPQRGCTNTGVIPAIRRGNDAGGTAHTRGARSVLTLAAAVLILLWMLPRTVLGQDYPTQITVALDGSGDFTSIQQAIYATKAFPYERITIRIKNGVYREKVEVFSWNPGVSFIGESRDGTIISYDDHFDKLNLGRNSTFHTYTLRVSGNDFHAENLTIANTSGPVGQAVALQVEADRASFVNVSLKGFQDTLYLAGEGHRTLFRDCDIEGTTDFIFGAGTALFEDCEIRSLADSFITAASTPAQAEFGFVFRNCELTAAPGVERVYLGRPWRRHANTVFLKSRLGDHILPEGWDNWNSPANEATAFYAEFGNRGPGAKTDERVGGSRQLSEQQAARYTREAILRGWTPPL